MFELLLITAVLTLVDPTGDVVGAESLQPPTAGVYRNLAPFDLRRVTVTDDQPLTLQVEMGSLSNPFDLPLGFSLPVIEIYLEEPGDDSGRQELLSGSSMRLPQGRSWEVALRLTGETAVAYRVDGEELQEATPGIAVDGNVLTVTTPFERPRNIRVYAMTGLYDLFGASPWRPLESSESPWAFSHETQRAPVVDVLARSAAAQRQSIESQVLMPAGSRGSVGGSIWLVLMAVGMFLALVGVAMRTLARGISQRGGGGASEPISGETFGEGPAATSTPTGFVSGYPPEQDASEWTVDSATSRAELPAREEAESSGSQRTSETSEERAAFAWDSSALLTQAGEDDFADEFGTSDASSRTQPAARTGSSERGSAVWERPVPLKLPQESDGGIVEGESADSLEVVRDHEVEEAGSADEGSVVNEDGPTAVVSIEGEAGCAEQDTVDENHEDFAASDTADDEESSETEGEQSEDSNPDVQSAEEQQPDPQVSETSESVGKNSRGRSRKRKPEDG